MVTITGKKKKEGKGMAAAEAQIKERDERKLGEKGKKVKFGVNEVESVFNLPPGKKTGGRGEGRIFRSGSGRASGITLPGEDGRTFLGLSERETAELAAQQGFQLPEIEQARERRLREEARAEAVGGVAEELGELGVLDAQKPTDVTQLDVERTGLGKLPIIGPSIQAGKGIPFSEAVVLPFNLPAALAIYGKKKGWFGGSDSQEIETLIQNPETARLIALQEIQQAVINDQTSTSEKTGAVIEGIPLVGTQAEKYAGGMIERPSDNVDTIISTIGDMGNTITNQREKLLKPYSNPSEAIKFANKMEAQVAAMEMRIKLLSLESSQLIADADTLNNIEQEILDTRLRIFDFRDEAAEVMITRAQEEISDEEIMLTLRDIKDGKLK